MHLLEGNHAAENAALRKRLHERMEALKARARCSRQGGDEESLGGAAASAANRPAL